ncbi:MAG: S1 family peptidase [Polyangiaceae bacterium]
MSLTHRRVASAFGLVALGLLLTALIVRPAGATKRVISGASEADVLAKNAAEPLCKVCPCTTRVRTTTAEGTGGPKRDVVVHVHVVFDRSSSFIFPHPRGGEGSELHDEVEQRRRSRDSALGVGAQSISLWKDAVNGTVGGLKNKDAHESLWARAISDATRSPRVQMDQEIHWLPSTGAGPTVTSRRRDIFTPTSTSISALPDWSSKSDACHPHAFIVVTDGLDHIDDKHPEERQHPALQTMLAQRAETTHVLFAVANPLSRYEYFRSGDDPCHAQQQQQKTPFCVWAPIEHPMAEVRYGKIQNWSDYLDAVNHPKASAGELQRVATAFLQRIEEDAQRACGGPSDDTPSAATTEYEAEQEIPLPPIGDAVLLGDEAQWKCTGALVAPGAVLTAAHCLPVTRVASTDDAAAPGTPLKVTESARPPGEGVDAVLLRLTRALVVTPAPRRTDAGAAGPAGVLRFVGYGATDSQGRGGFGHRHVVDLSVTGWGCDAERAERTGCVPGSEMVVLGSAGHDTCRGDSGGPLYELWGNGKACGYRLVGVASRRVADAVVPCGNGGIYTRVDVLDGWITGQLKKWTGDETKGDAP